MNIQPPSSKTFKMRPGKQLVYVFCGIWCLMISVFFTWEALQYKYWSTTSFLLFIFLICIPLYGLFICWKYVSSKLTFSVHGIIFQGPYSTKMASWEEIKGFYEQSGELFLLIPKKDCPNELTGGIPLSWFAKVRTDEKMYMADNVMESLTIFAPHLFNKSSSV